MYFVDFEKRCIKATGEVQEVVGCGVSFHPGRDSKAPFEIVRLYLEAGGKANKCVMSHLDSKFFFGLLYSSSSGKLCSIDKCSPIMFYVFHSEHSC